MADGSMVVGGATGWDVWSSVCEGCNTNQMPTPSPISTTAITAVTITTAIMVVLEPLPDVVPTG